MAQNQGLPVPVVSSENGADKEELSDIMGEAFPELAVLAAKLAARLKEIFSNICHICATAAPPTQTFPPPVVLTPH
jgi:hypothetical protein